MRHVLLVDDEPLVLKSLVRAFRQHRAEWTVETAGSGAEALTRLAHGGIDAVLCDFYMPELGGEQVLGLVQRDHPDVVRVALSGRVDGELARRLTPVVHQLVAKPFDAQALFELVEEALRARDLVASPALRRLVGQLGSLPALPQTFGAVLAEVRRPAPSLDRVIALVGADPSLAADVLRLVNSAYVGLSRKVSSVAEAVRLIGLLQTELLVLSAEVYGGPNATALGAELQRAVLERCRRVKAVLEAAGRPEFLQAAQTAAILSDVGLMALAARAPALFAQLEHARAVHGSGWAEAEQALLGTHHGVLGGAVLGLWRLPADVCQAVTLQHGPWTTTPRPSPAAALGLVAALEQLQQPGPSEARPGAALAALCAAFPTLDVAPFLSTAEELS